MEDTQIQSPAFKAGTLKDSCFNNPQEMLEAFAKALYFSEDVVKTLKGATGPAGADGADGADGASGSSGGSSGYSELVTLIPISSGSTYVEIPDTGLTNDKFSILSKREVDPVLSPPAPTAYPAFVPANGIVGCGTLVEDEANNRTRMYFTFTPAAIVAVPNADFVLVWIKGA